MITKIGNTKLVYNRFNNYYKWQLRPDHLFSDKFYVTAEGYKTFDMFDFAQKNYQTNDDGYVSLISRV